MRSRARGGARWVGPWLAMVMLLAGSAAAASSGPFPRPPALEENVAFWRDVFARYSRNQVVIHDDTNLGIVYDVLDFRAWAGPNGRLDAKHERMREERVRAAKEHYTAILRRLHARGGRPGSSEEKRVHALFQRIQEPNRFRVASERVRSQSGLKEQFTAGVARLKGYEPEMVRIFLAEGVPPELTRMSLVESTFDLEAYSRVGAAGVWQFMPRTGREYLKIDSAVDERRDPLRATAAAAEHLRRDYQALGAWPLAITAYNHGRGGIAKAVKSVGSPDMGRIVREYDGPRFGFASRNFYAEFLAALDVTSNEEKYFGGRIAPVPAPRSREVRLQGSTHLHHAARRVGVTPETLIAMNPAFLARVVDGRSAIPRDYRLRIPVTPADGHLALAQSNSRREAAGKPLYVVHEVRRGQTLGGIARRYGTTVATLQSLNGIQRPSSLQAGRLIKVPAAG